MSKDVESIYLMASHPLSWPGDFHGSLNVPIEHHPTIRYMVYNGYYKVMSNSPKMGHLPIPDFLVQNFEASNDLGAAAVVRKVHEPQIGCAKLTRQVVPVGGSS